MNPTIKGILFGIAFIFVLNGIHTFNMWLLSTFTHEQIMAGFYTVVLIVSVMFARWWHRVN